MEKLNQAINKCYEIAARPTTCEELKNKQLQMAAWLEELREYRNKHKVVYWEMVQKTNDGNGNTIKEYKCSNCKYAFTIPNNAMPTPSRCFSCDSRIVGVLYDD